MNNYTELLTRLGELSDEYEMLKMTDSATGEALLEIELEIDGIECQLALIPEGK